MNIRDDRGPRTIYLVAGIILLIFGYGLYLFYRGPGATLIDSWPASRALVRAIPHSEGFAPWAGWMPSFIYVLSFSLLSAAILGAGPRSRFLIPVFWLTVASVFEAGQYLHLSVKSIVPALWADSITVRYLDNYFLLGTFDPLDLGAGFVGMLAAVLAFGLTRGRHVAPDAWRPAARCLRRAAGFSAFLIGIACLLATSSICEPTAFPVYMSYDDLRKPVVAAAPSALSGAGKIYVYGNLILLNEPNQGIHVIDNTDPRLPSNLLFLPIPGNIDMAVKDNVLYADSYIDLVAIDITNMSDIREIRRIQGVFPYDPYQNIQDLGVDFCSSYNPNKGVIVDYTKR